MGYPVLLVMARLASELGEYDGEEVVLESLLKQSRIPPTLPTGIDYSSNTQALEVVPKAAAQCAIVGTNAISSLINAVSQS